MPKKPTISDDTKKSILREVDSAALMERAKARAAATTKETTPTPPPYTIAMQDVIAQAMSVAKRDVDAYLPDSVQRRTLLNNLEQQLSETLARTPGRLNVGQLNVLQNKAQSTAERLQGKPYAARSALIADLLQQALSEMKAAKPNALERLQILGQPHTASQRSALWQDFATPPAAQPPSPPRPHKIAEAEASQNIGTTKFFPVQSVIISAPEPEPKPLASSEPADLTAMEIPSTIIIPDPVEPKKAIPAPVLPIAETEPTAAAEAADPKPARSKAPPKPKKPKASQADVHEPAMQNQWAERYPAIVKTPIVPNPAGPRYSASKKTTAPADFMQACKAMKSWLDANDYECDALTRPAELKEGTFSQLLSRLAPVRNAVGKGPGKKLYDALVESHPGAKLSRGELWGSNGVVGRS